MVKQGLNQDVQQALVDLLNQNDGHLFPISSSLVQAWQQEVPTRETSKRYFLLDDASCALTADHASALSKILEKAGYDFIPEIAPRFLGWEYFAHGMLEQGVNLVKGMMEEFRQKGVRELIVLTGQAEYLWRVYLPKLGIKHDLHVTNIIDLAEEIQLPEQSFVYAGSFLTRYLMKGEELNQATPNTREHVLPRSEEFVQTFLADKRMNEVNIWQKPLCAEYVAFGISQEIQDKIFEDSFGDIARTPHKNLVVFDPFAYARLKEKKAQEQIVYFVDCLK